MEVCHVCRAGQGEGVPPHRSRGSPHRALPLAACELDYLFMFRRSTQNRCCTPFSDFVDTFSCILSILLVVFLLVLNCFLLEEAL